MARILLIEDSPTDTAVLTQLLERNGHQVLASASAEDGIEVCKRELPDLVLMDVVLPGMNGFQATRALSRDARHQRDPGADREHQGHGNRPAPGACARAPRTTSSSRRTRPPDRPHQRTAGRLNVQRHPETMPASRRAGISAAVDVMLAERRPTSRSATPLDRSCLPFESSPTTSAAAWRTSSACPSSSTHRACGAASAIASASKRLASGFDEVVEILPMPQVTPVPGAQPWMLGVANIRGNLLPIVDLKQFLEGERTVMHEGQRVLIVRQPGGDVAVTIDELYRTAQLHRRTEDRQRGQGLAEGRYAHFIDRAYRLAEHPWGVFSLSRLARTPEFRQAAA